MEALAIGAGFNAVLGDVGCGKLVETNIMKGEHKTPEMLAINPFGGIPFLKDGDFCLAEQNTMYRYIAAKYAPELYGGTDPHRKGTIDWALDYTGGAYQDTNLFWYATIGFKKLPEAEDEAQAAREKTYSILEKFVSKFLSTGPFVDGESLSVADYRLCTMLALLAHPAVKTKTGFSPYEGYDAAPKVKAYVEAFLAKSKTAAASIEPGTKFLDAKLA